MPIDGRDVRILIPQIRRRLDPGVAAASAAGTYSDDTLKFIAADAVAELIVVGGDRFPYTLTVASADINGYPVEYTVDPELPLAVQALVSIQAALGQVFTEMRGLITSEKIQNEGGTWEYTKSANILRDKAKWLLEQRDLALKQVAIVPALDVFVNLMHERDADLAAEVEAFAVD